LYYRNVICPSGAQLNVTCPIYAKGVYNVTCPAERDEPQCTTFDGTSFVINPLCKVIDFTPHNTTCYCEGGEASAGRRLQTAGESVLTEYSSSLIVIAENIGSTFIAAPSLTDVRRNFVILGTLIGVVALFLVGMIGFAWWDATYLAAAKRKQEKKVRTVKYRTFVKFYESIFPAQLRDGKWYEVFWYHMKLEHPWAALYATQKMSKYGKTSKWAVVMGDLIIFLFVSSIIAVVLYADDGYCEEFTEPSKCTDATTTGGFFHACKWRTDNESCEYEPLKIDFYTTIVLTIIASMLVVPFEKLNRYSVMMIAQYFHYKRLNHAVIPTNTSVVETVLQPRFDEFALAQTMRSTLFRAARLEKAKKTMDFVLPASEADAVLAQVAAQEVQVQDHKAFRNVVAAATTSRQRYQLTSRKRQDVIKRIEVCRDQVGNMKKELEHMDSAEDQEIYLMRHFIVDIFDGPRRGVVSRHFLEEYNTRRNKWHERLSLVFLPLMLAVMIYFVYVFNLSIGSRATNMWLIVTSINFFQDVFFLKPLKVWFNFVLINGTVSREVRELCEQLTRRSKLILMRTHGMVRDTEALVQHFNPAVRAARMHPGLPVSRLLMSLNDFDIPLQPKHSIFYLPWVYFMTGLLTLTLLPEVLQDSSIEVLSNAIIQFGAIGFYRLGVTSLLAALVVGLGILLIILLREWYLIGFRSPFKRTRNYQVGVTEDWPFKENNFLTLEDDDDEQESPARLKERDKTFAAPPPSGRKSLLTIKSLAEASKYEEDSDSEGGGEVIMSELINFDGVDQMLAYPQADELLASGKNMNSVASLQNFKRPQSSSLDALINANRPDSPNAMDDNSSFFTELHSHLGNTSGILPSRGNSHMDSRRNSSQIDSRRNSTRLGTPAAAASTYNVRSGLLMPGMTPVAGPPIASFQSENASIFENSIASSMSVNARLNSGVKGRYSEHHPGIHGDDIFINGGIGMMNSEFEGAFGESKQVSPQGSLKAMPVDTNDPNWFKAILYNANSSQVDESDNASYSVPFAAQAARFAHPHTAQGLFGGPPDASEDLSPENSVVLGAELAQSSWVMKDKLNAPTTTTTGSSFVTDLLRTAPYTTRETSFMQRGIQKARAEKSDVQSRKTRRSKNRHIRHQSRDQLDDAASVMTGTSEFVSSSILQSPVATSSPGYVYRKYAGRMRRRAESGGHSAEVLTHSAQSSGPGAHSTRDLASPSDFLTLQAQYQVSPQMTAPMPVISYGDEGQPGSAGERFGLNLNTATPSGPPAASAAGAGPGGRNPVPPSSGPGSSSFPMYQY